MFGPGKFRFLNEIRELSFPEGWNDPDAEKLWLYNLHYFEDLIADGAGERIDWHRDLIEHWVSGNPPFEGIGWEPYPVSLRICNWVKWALQGNDIEQSWLRSLALQAEHLYHRVEWHLLGNHVFENARALVLAGLYFEGPRAERWLDKGVRILDKQLDEQILADGGHFERSPMYHAIVLEGLLDLVQVSEHYRRHEDRIGSWRSCAGRMAIWLRIMLHPDGEISFFNDAAFDIALPPALLIDYAERLGVVSPEIETGEGVTCLEDSGYIRAVRGPLVALLDVAPVGSDYQPGHAHADTLSFELSVFGRRVLVNSGTSVYGLGEERLRQRGTAAHNTVVIDGRDSSEVWSGFRVGRRARPFDVSIRASKGEWQIKASHDGYRRFPSGVVHQRTWRLTDSQLIVEDQLVGENNRAAACFHFHPEVRVVFSGSEGTAALESGEHVDISIVAGVGELTNSSHHPEFGVSVATQCLAVSLRSGICRVVFGYPAKSL